MFTSNIIKRLYQLETRLKELERQCDRIEASQPFQRLIIPRDLFATRKDKFDYV